MPGHRELLCVLIPCFRTLSAHALAALASFNAEKDEHAQKFEKLKAAAEADGPLSMEAFTEDWNVSQFWVGNAITLCARG